MKYVTKLFLASLSTALLLTAPVSAVSSAHLGLNNAYDKGQGNYDVVVKANPYEKLGLYINDKNPVYATANKTDWATFHKVKLADKAKLSFTQVFKAKNGKTPQKPINYVRYASLSGHKFSFVSALPIAKPAAPAKSSDTASTTNTGVNDTNLSNNNTYVNSNGTTVHSPADSTDGTVPAGATARCVDGTYSFSQTHSGTCSHHGGVASWL